MREIQQYLKSAYSEFDKRIKEVLSSDVRFIDLITEYTLRIKGKRIRPSLTMLSASIFGDIKLSAINAAITMELLHNATLMHDDVVDGADTRRGFKTVNKIWNNKTAILFGDYLLANSLITILDTRDFKIMDILSSVSRKLSRGELLQVFKTKKGDFTESMYLDVIKGKTASLISACTQIGAITGGATEEDSTKMAEFGELLGIAFQIRDDILDYTGDKGIFGKENGKDIKEKKITLPLIYALSNTDKKTKNKILKAIRVGIKTKSELDEILKFTIDNNGISIAENKVFEISERAKSIISSINCKNCESIKMLKLLADYLVFRDK
ncbi:MAG: polyprenyl synthetase family protein [Candidatus Delongbacteria bacterium]|nr:polyprenyl synthetase family protein [Candidatus Delongbacteria bacterium]MBN2834905.1 polyprenyl synthetase family protein [Candidatus Delongbacteria bacterium]